MVAISSSPFSTAQAYSRGRSTAAQVVADGPPPSGSTNEEKEKTAATSPTVQIAPRHSVGSFVALCQDFIGQANGGAEWNDAPKADPPAFNSDGSAHGVGMGYYLSTGDRKMVESVTGHHFNERDVLVDDAGQPVSGDFNVVIGQMALDRHSGADLRGALTPAYMEKLAGRFAAHGETVDRSFIDKAIKYLS